MSPRKNFITLMSTEQRQEFDSRIRLAGYGQSEEIAKWVTEDLGITTSRTAVARYEKILRESDGVHGQGGSMNAVAHFSGSGGKLAKLYQELGELEVRKLNILEQIREMTE